MTIEDEETIADLRSLVEILRRTIDIHIEKDSKQRADLRTLRAISKAALAVAADHKVPCARKNSINVCSLCTLKDALAEDGA